MSEVWKDIIGYEGHYAVSNTGLVKSLSRFRLSRDGAMASLSEKLLRFGTTESGYYKVSLYKNAKKLTFNVHRLVAETFLPFVEDKPTVNHKDGNKLNNHLDNLEWASSKDQIDHAISMNLLEKRGKAKFTLDDKQVVIDFYRDNPESSILSLSKKFKMSQRTISRIIKGGIKTRKNVRVLSDGSRIERSVLSRNDVEEILRLRSEGYTLKYISEKFERGISQIHRITTGQSRIESPYYE